METSAMRVAQKLDLADRAVDFAGYLARATEKLIEAVLEQDLACDCYERALTQPYGAHPDIASGIDTALVSLEAAQHRCATARQAAELAVQEFRKRKQKLRCIPNIALVARVG